MPGFHGCRIFFSLAFCVVSFNDIIALMPDFAMAVDALEMITNLVQEDSEFDSTMDALNEEGEELGAFKGKVELSHVYFQYSSENQVFKGLNLKIPAGQTFAFTGPASFGGTTLLALIHRFYDVKTGALVRQSETRELHFSISVKSALHLTYCTVAR